MRNAYKIILDGKPEGKRPLERSRGTWEHNIKLNLTEVKCKDVDWIHLAQDSAQCKHSNESSGFIKGKNF